MKECKCECNYEDVQGGDIFEDLTPLLEDTYFIVCVKKGEKRLYSLSRGCVFSQNNVFGSQGREGFRKVNVCYKVEED